MNPWPERGREAGQWRGERGGLGPSVPPFPPWDWDSTQPPTLGRQQGEHTLSRPLGQPATQYSDDDDSNDDCDDEGDDNDDMIWDIP